MERTTVYLSLMKHPSLDYDYLRRWGPLLLLALFLGALSGLGYVLQQPREDFIVSAKFRVDSQLDFTVVSRAEPTRQAAAKYIGALASDLDSLVDQRIEIIEVSIQGRDKPNWWKPIVLGSVTGALLIIGAIYVWEDIKSYKRNR